jgi:hypothetical protein
MTKKPNTLIIKYFVKRHLILAKQIKLICYTFYIRYLIAAINCTQKLGNYKIYKLIWLQLLIRGYTNYYITHAITVAETINLL